MNRERYAVIGMNSRAKPWLLSAAGLGLICFLALPACRAKTESDKVKAVVLKIQKAAEDKDIKTILGNLSNAYHDPQGNDYNGIKEVLLFYFFRHQKVSVYIPNLDVAITGPSAHAVFQAVLTGRGKETTAPSVLPHDLGMYTFDVTLEKEKGTWKIISATWEPAGAAAPPR